MGIQAIALAFHFTKKWRIFREMKKSNIGTYVFLGIGILLMVIGKITNSDVGAAGFLVTIASVLYWAVPITWRLFFGSTGIVTVEQWITALPECKYKHGKGYYGIALDEVKQNIHLFDNGFSKIYPFSDIREWTTNVATGGKIHAAFGTGLVNVANSFSVGSANRAQDKQNQEETGFFISVRDIDRPVWRIRFTDDIEGEAKFHARWMEILKQVVNKH